MNIIKAIIKAIVDALKQMGRGFEAANNVQRF